MTRRLDDDDGRMPDPHVLVLFATRHGSTREIAETIGDELRAAGFRVDVMAVDQAVVLAQYDAVVIGSAVYVGRWLTDARRFVERRIADLTRRPVWLFSSGPVDGSANVGEVPPVRSVAAVAERLAARGHATFGGRVGAGMSGPTERWVIRGDWRDFGAVRRWAAGIAVEIRSSRQSPMSVSSLPVPDATPVRRSETVAT
jgi:menaquinone-dependent protoporphyrinogen oxidase